MVAIADSRRRPSRWRNQSIVRLRTTTTSHVERGRVRVEVVRAAAQPREIVLAKHVAHAREDVHDVVGFAGVVADRAEDQVPVALDEKVPRAFRVTGFEQSDPRFHHGPSDCLTRPDISRVSARVNRRVRTLLPATEW